MKNHTFLISENTQPFCAVNADGQSRRAAEILCTYLQKITGAPFAVSEFSMLQHHIYFEKTDAFGSQGFGYGALDRKLTFRAQSEQSFVHAVYDFLERVLGCRFYTPDCESIPRNANLTVEVEPYSFVPPLGFREVYYRAYQDKAFSEKHKMSPARAHEGWGFWCHSFQELLPNADYFEEHPEYFALIDGKRNPNGQPCLSHPAVFEIMRDNLRTRMLENPACTYWSVSQNDNDLYCRCEACAARDEADGGPMGSILWFVNKMAAEFPDKILSTLAYWYSRKPPLVTRPASNVHIMLCNIEALRGEPIECGPRNAGSRDELLAWADICDNLFLWDYCVQFANLVSPFPNLRVLAPNIRFFTEHHVRSLFSQCNRERGGEFAELRGYLLAKLMWDPEQDPQAVMQDFCTGYYGAAAEDILAYIDRLHDALDESGAPLSIFDGPSVQRDSFLTEPLFEEYDALFERAEQRVRADAARLLRVQTARLPVYFAGLSLGYGAREKRLQMLTSFARTVRATGLEMVEEWRITADRFVTDMAAKLALEA